MPEPIHAVSLDAFQDPSEPIENTEDAAREMQKRHGSKFASCPCGRKRVLMYSRGTEGTGIARGIFTGSGNGPRSDRLTYHNTPQGITCEHGGKYLDEVPGAAEVTL